MVKVIATPERQRTLFRTIARHLSRNPAASFDQLAGAAGISRRTLYRIAASRDELISLLMREALQASDDTLARVDVAKQEPLVSLRALSSEFLRDSPLYAFWDHAGAEAAETPEHMRRYREIMHSLFEKGQASGTFRCDLPANWLAASYDALLVAASSTLAGPPTEDEELVAQMLAMFLDGARARPRRAKRALQQSAPAKPERP